MCVRCTGLEPNVARTFLVNAAELGTYDEAKSHLVPVLGDGFFAHVRHPEPQLRHVESNTRRNKS